MNTSHYPNLELCRKLTEIGFPETEILMDVDSWTPQRQSQSFLWCPSVMEMLDVMPKEINWRLLIIISYGDERINLWYWDETKIPDKNWPLPNALAEMILFLHENNYISFSK